MGIVASRLAGLGRETVASRLLGNTGAADAFAVAMRIPNMLQNLLGEGVLSASFVPVYSQLLDRSIRPDEAQANDGDPEDDGEQDAAPEEIAAREQRRREQMVQEAGQVAGPSPPRS